MATKRKASKSVVNGVSMVATPEKKTDGPDWKYRHAQYAQLPPISTEWDACWPIKVKKPDVEGLRRDYCVRAPDEMACDDRCESLRGLSDPVAILKVVAPHLLPEGIDGGIAPEPEWTNEPPEWYVKLMAGER